MEKKELTGRVQIFRSKRKTVSLEIKPDMQIIVRVPLGMRREDIFCFLEAKSQWIEKHSEAVRQRQMQKMPTLSPDEVRSLARKAAEDIPRRAETFSAVLGVTYEKITIRNQKTRWGSCTSKGNLNFNCLLMLCPEEVRDYVVVHELCHRKEMNHSPRFWALVGSILPDYPLRRKWLKENGRILIGRLG